MADKYELADAMRAAIDTFGAQLKAIGEATGGADDALKAEAQSTVARMIPAMAVEFGLTYPTMSIMSTRENGVDVAVTDKKGLPVRNVDIEAEYIPVVETDHYFKVRKAMVQYLAGYLVRKDKADADAEAKRAGNNARQMVHHWVTRAEDIGVWRREAERADPLTKLADKIHDRVKGLMSKKGSFEDIGQRRAMLLAWGSHLEVSIKAAIQERDWHIAQEAKAAAEKAAADKAATDKAAAKAAAAREDAMKHEILAQVLASLPAAARAEYDAAQAASMQEGAPRKR